MRSVLTIIMITMTCFRKQSNVAALSSRDLACAVAAAICLQAALQIGMSLTKLAPSTMAEALHRAIVTMWATRCHVWLQSSIRSLPNPEK